MHSERLRERKLLTHKNSIKRVKCCGAVAFFKPKGEQLLALFFYLSFNIPNACPLTNQLIPKKVNAIASTMKVFAKKLTGRIINAKAQSVPIPQTR